MRIFPLVAGCCLLVAAPGCSRVERVKVVNGFDQPVRIRLNGKDTSPPAPAHGEAVLDGRFYIGRGVRVTVLTLRGHVLQSEMFNPVPGDSAFRRVAVVEVGP